MIVPLNRVRLETRQKADRFVGELACDYDGVPVLLATANAPTKHLCREALCDCVERRAAALGLDFDAYVSHQYRWQYEGRIARAAGNTPTESPR